MGAGSAWFFSIAAVLLLVLTLHQMGVNASADIGAALRGAVEVLGKPLTVL